MMLNSLWLHPGTSLRLRLRQKKQHRLDKKTTIQKRGFHMMQGTPESLPIVMAMNATGW
jgi:hypothetical protein